jgi:hypothetical protein
MQKAVIVEPLVDVVEKDMISTNDSTFFSIDLNTCTKEDLDFSNEYHLKI